MKGLLVKLVDWFMGFVYVWGAAYTWISLQSGIKPMSEMEHFLFAIALFYFPGRLLRKKIDEK